MRNCVETRRPQGGEFSHNFEFFQRRVSTQFLVFPIFTSVDRTVYQYGKNVLYFFYDIAQRTLKEEWREIFRVDIELYQHGSSAFRIYKCYILKVFIIYMFYNSFDQVACNKYKLSCTKMN